VDGGKGNKRGSWEETEGRRAREGKKRGEGKINRSRQCKGGGRGAQKGKADSGLKEREVHRVGGGEVKGLPLVYDKKKKGCGFQKGKSREIDKTHIRSGRKEKGNKALSKTP